MDPGLARLWYLSLALLLLGLAYEGWLMLRAGLGMALSSGKPRWILGRAGMLQMTFTHRLPRPLTLEVATDPPAAIEIDGAVRTLVVPQGEGASMAVAGCSPAVWAVLAYATARPRTRASDARLFPRFRRDEV